MDSIKSLLGDKQPEKEPSVWDDLNNQCSLTFTQRVIGFGICAGLGLLFAFLSFIFILSPTSFAFLFTVGDILMVLATGFIVGPVKQFKNMMEPHRLICAIVFIASMALTLTAVFLGWSFIIVIFFIILQICALLYYTFSYIPYGRQCLRGLCSGVASV
ncbi:hypothetical protein DICPUDRAFT_93731 [Dictyostelium purpureum]|uniref:Vesicle transport protein n=1 Tax=Dictyostelium purpureum TaxID=5786 RepID=F0ZAZ9_DICPU|nr:uncharacterized protein DICPUDRAFT_93731 [Dictyostelium purpureum]EGC38887.1 hypothetical protein DICPUDRAFT_93731 [Dictyostelium purpureum]|eukprot:XP_003284567.1 hypothetical protein DICPUDRAFT_93731 [Dictyostelium purpureum]